MITEALYFSLPVMSTGCSKRAAEIHGKVRWGRFTPIGDSQALTRAIKESLSIRVDRDDLKRRAADFSPEIAARKYLDLLGLS